MSKLILATRNQIAEVILRRGFAQSVREVPADNRRLVIGQAKLQDLIPLTWRNKELVFVNGNCFDMNKVAAELLFCSKNDIDNAQQAYVRRNLGECKIQEQEKPGQFAYPGDVIVCVPMAGRGCDVKYGDLAAYRAYFRDKTVPVGFIGPKLPAGVAAAFKNVDWKPATIGGETLADRAKKMAEKTVSIFDAIDFGFCVPGVEDFQERYFPGRLEVSVEELIPHLGNSYVERLVGHVVGYPDGTGEAPRAAIERAFAY